MPIYGTPQAGSNTAGAAYNIRAVIPGDSFTFFDGTETVANGLASIAFNRGYSPTGSNNVTVYVQGAPASGFTIDLQGAMTNEEADYYTITTITPDANGNGAASDDGTAAFLRMKISAYSSGAMPIVKGRM